MENSFVSFFAAVINQNMCRGRQLSAKSSVVINTLTRHPSCVDTFGFLLDPSLITITKTALNAANIWNDVSAQLRFATQPHYLAVHD